MVQEGGGEIRGLGPCKLCVIKSYRCAIEKLCVVDTESIQGTAM